jgi:tetratricopeptide (TPR) repeat protein
MTLVSSPKSLSAEEQEQIRQTIEMFEVITQANPQDTHSLEVLKEAHMQLGQTAESLTISKRLAEAFMELSQYSSALLEYEAILLKEPDNTDIIAALGEVENRLSANSEPGHGAGAAEIAMDFKSLVTGGNLVVTDKTQMSERGAADVSVDAASVAARLASAGDGNDALVKFLSNNRLAPDDVITQALTVIRRRNKDRKEQQPAASLIDEIITRGSVDGEQMLCGILDRSKFAYIPIEMYEMDRQIVKMLPESMTHGRLIVPFDVISRTVMIALANPFDTPGKEAVRQLLDYNVQWHFASPEGIIKALNNLNSTRR